MEIFSEQYRGILTVVILSFWSLGAIVLGIMAYFFREWWSLQLATGVPMVIGIVCSWYV